MHESNWILRLNNKCKDFIDANNLDKKIFINNVTNLLFLSLINFNLFLLKTLKIVQHTLVRCFVKTLFQFI